MMLYVKDWIENKCIAFITDAHMQLLPEDLFEVCQFAVFDA